ncbi:ABC transporter permease [Kitasatospora paranensis]|uniref:Transport permease protein n=1 Tax=Kitasatospora paranensis TaxID=258053 RepID=A0ABW2G0M2_9ACTN
MAARRFPWRALRALVGSEARLFLREPAAWFFTVVFPSLLVAILGSVPGFRTPVPELGGLSTVAAYAPITVVFGLTMLAMNGVAPVFTGYRERGVLRRLSASPVPAGLVLGALTLVYLVVAVVSLVLVVVVGRAGFGVALPRQPLALVVVFLLGAASLFACGLLVAALAPTAKVGNAVGTALFFPLMFFSGLWVPRALMPGVLRRIGDFLPSGAATQAVQDAWQGRWPQSGDVATMVLFAVVVGVVAAKSFRWE